MRLAEKEETSITVYSDFRKTSYGIWYPYASQSLDEEGKENGGPVQLTKVEVNVPVEATLFEMPMKNK